MGNFLVMGVFLKLFLFYYIAGIIVTFIITFTAMCKHITFWGIFTTIIISLFSWFALIRLGIRYGNKL
jgi:hypothetical protein